VVGHICAGVRKGMDTREVTHATEFRPQPLANMRGDLVRISLQLFGVILRELLDRGLSGVPKSGAVLIEVRRSRCQTAQCVPKDLRRLAWHDAAKLHTAILEPSMS